MVSVCRRAIIAGLCVSSLLAGVSLSTLAAGPLRLRPGMTGVADLGAITCETFSHMYPNGPTGMSQAVLTWAQGYFYALSGGQTTDQILEKLPADSGWDFDSLTGHMVRYCQAHPEAGVPEAVESLWSALSSG